MLRRRKGCNRCQKYPKRCHSSSKLLKIARAKMTTFDKSHPTDVHTCDNLANQTNTTHRYHIPLPPHSHTHAFKVFHHLVSWTNPWIPDSGNVDPDGGTWIQPEGFQRNGACQRLINAPCCPHSTEFGTRFIQVPNVVFLL